MGTSVKIRAREEQCRGAGPCIPRKMTEEEKLKYANIKPLKEKPPIGVLEEEFLDMEDIRMNKKIDPPSKEKLIEVLAECQGKTKAVYHACKAYDVSVPVIHRWIKDYGIEFDYEGRVIKKSEDVVGDLPPAEEKNDNHEPQESNSNNSVGCFESDVMADQERAKAMTEKEAKSIKNLCNLGYAEYDIGDSLIQIDYRKKLVSINEGKEMSFDDATKVSDLLSSLIKKFGSEVKED